MNLYLLRQRHEAGYDEVKGFVIRAATGREAREIADTKAGDEGDIWTSARETSCALIGATATKTPRVILRAFNAA